VLLGTRRGFGRAALRAVSLEPLGAGARVLTGFASHRASEASSGNDGAQLLASIL
jgi:hypothetical protein